MNKLMLTAFSQTDITVKTVKQLYVVLIWFQLPPILVDLLEKAQVKDKNMTLCWNCPYVCVCRMYVCMGG